MTQPRKDSSGSASPKVKVRKTFSGGRYVDAEELMRHPDVVAAMDRFSKNLGPIIKRDRERALNRWAGDGPGQANGA